MGDGPYNVLFTFDDGFESTYTIAYPYLKAHGCVGTLYMPNNTVNTPGYCTTEQLQEMNASGVILVANHGMTQAELTTLTEAQQEAEFAPAITWLESIGCVEGARHAAYSHGSYDANTPVAMANIGMISGRTVAPNPGDGIPLPLTDRYAIPCSTGVGPTTGLDWIKTHLNDAVTHKKLFILYYHDLADNPTGLQSSISDFYSTVDYVHSLGIQTLTIKQLCDAQGIV